MLLAVVVALLAAACAKHVVEDPYDAAFLRHRSFRTPEQIRRVEPLHHVVDGRDNS